jgi:tRNA C32,U32 (ribose-2'-O)-methylase TrmJ
VRYHLAVMETRAAQGARQDEAREKRLEQLHARWDQFATEYAAARERNDQEVMTNLRGLMLLIKREIKRLGGPLPEFPAEENHLSDL